MNRDCPTCAGYKARKAAELKRLVKARADALRDEFGLPQVREGETEAEERWLRNRCGHTDVGGRRC